MSGRSASSPGRLSPLSVPGVSSAASPRNTPLSARLAHSTGGGRFAVYGLAEGRDEPPKTFHEAAERGDTAWCVRAVERTIDFDINCRDRLMRTALHWAAEMGHCETAKTLLDFGVDLRLTDCTGRTALHLASKVGDAGMLGVLAAGLGVADLAALINAGDHNDITPAFLAIQRGDDGQEAFEWLLQHGARYNEDMAGAAGAPHAAAGQEG